MDTPTWPSAEYMEGFDRGLRLRERLPPLEYRITGSPFTILITHINKLTGQHEFFCNKPMLELRTPLQFQEWLDELSEMVGRWAELERELERKRDRREELQRARQDEREVVG